MADKFSLDLSDLSRYGAAKSSQNNARALAKLLELSEKHGVDLQRYRGQIERMLKTLADSPFGKKMIEDSAGPLKKLVEGKGSLGKVKGLPYLSFALFVVTASTEGGSAAAADLIGVDRSVVREFMSTGSVNLALQPWLLYESVESGSVGKLHDAYHHIGAFSWPIGKAKLQGVYRRPDDSLILVWEGSDGSTVPTQIYSSGRAYLPLHFQFVEPTKYLEQLRNGQ